MSRLFLFVPLLASAVLSACGGAKELDTATAQAALTKYVADKPLTSLIFLPKGLPGDLLEAPRGSNVIPTAFPNNDIPLTPILVKKGWAVAHYRKQPLFGVYRQEYVITDAGQTAMAGFAKGGDVYNLPVATERVASITNITKTDDTHATVEFNCIADPNELGKQLRSDGTYVPAAPLPSRGSIALALGDTNDVCAADLQLDDDGWKVST